MTIRAICHGQTNQLTIDKLLLFTQLSKQILLKSVHERNDFFINN